MLTRMVLKDAGIKREPGSRLRVDFTTIPPKQLNLKYIYAYKDGDEKDVKVAAGI